MNHRMDVNGKEDEEWNETDQWTLVDECVGSDGDDESENKCEHPKAETNNMNIINVNANKGENKGLPKQVNNIAVQRTFTCKKCLCAFPYRTELLYHKCKYKCSKCNNVFDEKTELECHAKIHDELKCDNCGKTITLKSKSESHKLKLINQQKSRLLCNICSLALDERYPCDECSKQFLTLKKLMEHKKLHDSCYCQICKMDFKDRESLDAHKSIHTEIHPRDKAWFCERCNKHFQNRTKLDEHKRTHSEDRSWRRK